MSGIHFLEKLLDQLAEQLALAIPLPTQHYDDRLAQWISFHGLKGNKISTAIAGQAALSLLLKSLVCHLIGPRRLTNRISAHTVLSEAEALVEQAGWGHLPSSYLDDLILRTDVSLNAQVVAQSASILQENREEDILGGLYARLVPQDARRPLGQFWTPAPIAEFMTRWAVQKPGDRVLDPAFGSGVFLLAVIERLTALGQSEVAVSGQIAGIELSPLVFLMGVTNVSLRYLQVRPSLLLGDFIVPHREPLEILREPGVAYETGALQLTLPSLEPSPPMIFPEHFDGLICNPPYTRHHHLPEAYKAAWAMQMEREFGLRLSRFSSLFAYFFVQAVRMLRQDGRMAFITPAAVFEASYSRRIKEFILSQLALRAIITFHESLSVFEGVDTAACITLLEKSSSPKLEEVTHIEVRRWPGVETLLEVVDRSAKAVYSWGTVCPIARHELHPVRKWTTIPRENERLSDERSVPLVRVARVVRGIATGANNFFVLSDPEVEKWGLNPDFLRPVLTKNREAPGYVFSQCDFERLGREGKKRWLLCLTEPVLPRTPEERYIRQGEAMGLHTRSLVKTRSHWYIMERREPAPIYFTYLSRKKSRFIYNRAGVLALNVFLCIYPEPLIAENEVTLKAFLTALNSTVSKEALRYVGRSYGGDTIKLEPREMDRLPVLNPLKLNSIEREQLAALFDRSCAVSSDEDEEAIHQAINEIVEVGP